MTKKEVTRKGRVLLKLMRGKGWKLRVWENMGWHYSVVSGPISVHPTLWSDETYYFSMISDDPKRAGGGAGIWTSSGLATRKDPNQSVKVSYKIMDSVVERHIQVREAAKRAAGLNDL